MITVAVAAAGTDSATCASTEFASGCGEDGTWKYSAPGAEATFEVLAPATTAAAPAEERDKAGGRTNSMSESESRLSAPPPPRRVPSNPRSLGRSPLPDFDDLCRTLASGVLEIALPFPLEARELAGREETSWDEVRVRSTLFLELPVVLVTPDRVFLLLLLLVVGMTTSGRVRVRIPDGPPAAVVLTIEEEVEFLPSPEVVVVVLLLWAGWIRVLTVAVLSSSDEVSEF